MSAHIVSLFVFDPLQDWCCFHSSYGFFANRWNVMFGYCHIMLSVCRLHVCNACVWCWSEDRVFLLKSNSINAQLFAWQVWRCNSNEIPSSGRSKYGNSFSTYGAIESISQRLPQSIIGSHILVMRWSVQKSITLTDLAGQTSTQSPVNKSNSPRVQQSAHVSSTVLYLSFLPPQTSALSSSFHKHVLLSRLHHSVEHDSSNLHVSQIIISYNKEATNTLDYCNSLLSLGVLLESCLSTCTMHAAGGDCDRQCYCS